MYYGRHNLTFCVLKQTLKKISNNSTFCTKANVKITENCKDPLEALIHKYESKILFNSTIEGRRIKLGYKQNNALMLKVDRYNQKLKYTLASVQPLPLSLKYLSATPELETLEKNDELKTENLIHFPYSNSQSITEQQNVIEELSNEDSENEVRFRYKLSKDMDNWMTAYDNFEHDLESGSGDDSWKINYGTPDPSSVISNVPCGGCGALLHCKDTAIPGYIPSEIFKNSKKKGSANLEAIICQRCYFLKEYNLALQVRVSADDYIKVLTTIRNKNALIVLMVDLTDFPCSIWPGIADILGPKTPIVVVGNKVDLLPSDGKYFLNRLKQNLLDHIKLSGFATSNILHVSLLSAKTGFGVEDLITSLHSLWRYKGDVYLVGCTNVGKSSLFNALLQSDYCKIQAADLIQRATTSQWPGTTLNLLKFPIMRPSGYRLYLRHQRIQALQQAISKEKHVRSEELRKFNNVKYATLIGHIGQTYSKLKNPEDETKDCFTTEGNLNASGKLKMGIKENDPDYALSRWCFDTPGVVQPDHILNMLTAEELINTLPRELIKPETFCVKAGTSLFIAGLARLDYLEGPGSVRLTVFRSNLLPITVCKLEEAEEIYKEFLGTDLFKVPVNEGHRLSKWPGLESTKLFVVTGTDWKSSCKDVVLSSAGWVAINCAPEKNYKFQAWSPEKRGIYIRDCILPKAVTLRGARIRYSVAYKAHKFV